MKKITLVLCMAAFTLAQPQSGWIDLLPGPNLRGWTIVDVPADGSLSPVPQWSVDLRKREVRCSGQGGRDWLRYDGKEFADFILHVEWKFDKLDTNAKYNSGVFVRNSAEFNIWHQAQCGSRSGGFLFGNSLVGGELKRSTTRDQISGKNPVKQAGQWNTYDITCQDSTITLSVNGVPTTRWQQLQVLKGYIGLEAEGFPIRFRNIRIRELVRP
jgi:hypothetical protein